MAITKIDTKRGIYRHMATGFVLHEIYNVQDALNANGVFFEDTINNKWIWFAGRDLRDLVLKCGATTLRDLATATIPVTFGFRGVTALPATQAEFMRAHFMGAAWNSRANRPAWNKCYGIVNGLDAGYGCSEDLGSVSNHGQSILGANGDGRSLQLFDTTRNGLHYGMGLIRFPTGCSWLEHIDQFFSAIPYREKPEVQEKVKNGKDLVIKALVARGVDPAKGADFWVPIVIRSNGTFQYVPAKTNNNLVTGYWTMKGQFMRALGSRMYFNSNRGCMFLPGGTSASTPECLSSYSRPQGQATSWPSPNSYNDVLNLPQVTHFDGIRIERMLGGLSGNLLSDGGEVNPSAIVNVSVAATLDAYLKQIIVTPTNQMVRPNDPTGVPVTDNVWRSQVETQYNMITNNDMSEVQLTQWDSHGFTLGYLLLLLGSAMDADKAKKKTVALWDVTRLPPMIGHTDEEPAAAVANAFPALPAYLEDRIFPLA